MIFVTVGSTDFDALVRAVDALCRPDGLLHGREVLMQIGEGRYEPTQTDFVRMAPSLEPYLAQAELVISHGGLGTLVEAMNRGCRLLAVDNPDRYDHHQQDLLTEFAVQGHLLWCRDLAGLEGDIQRALEMTPTPYACPPCTIHEVIHDFLRRERRKPGVKR